MANKINEPQTRAVAKLARLDLTDAEIAEFSCELSAIIEYIEKLGELNTDSVEPLAHCLPIHNVFRDDSVKASLELEQVLANAPQRVDDFFKVPKILDDNSGA